MNVRAVFLGFLVACTALIAARAEARVTRYALLVGNDRGEKNQVELAYAERDAERMYQVLRDVGGFDPANMVLLRGERASMVEKTLVTLNDRVRAELDTPGNEVLLFVYYSGHADAEALSLDGSRLELATLTQLVRGSAATFRVLVLDACRSGAVTRKKGGRMAPAFALQTEASLPGSGMAFLAASAAHEDAQESDAIGGSFFTHALVSGLLGAADENDDGAVALEEAYRYAYDATLRATARSMSGTQHPTFHYDLRGQGSLTLTRPFDQKGERALLTLPSERNYLVMRDGPSGQVVAELGARDKARTLSLRPGRYYLMGRTYSYLLEGPLELRAGEARVPKDDEFARVAYARLVRKGGSVERSAGLFAGYTLRSALPNAETPCHGPVLGLSADLPELSIRPRLTLCRSGSENARVRATVDELDVEARVVRSFDWRRLALGLGLGAGGGVFFQHFDTTRTAPDVWTGYGSLLVSLEADVDLGHGLFLLADLSGKSYFFAMRQGGEREIESGFAVRGGLSLGMRF